MPIKIDLLVVAGGGSGGMYTTTNSNGGGGAGGVLIGTQVSASSLVSLTVTVGGGGSGIPNGSSGRGNTGSNSSLGSTFIANGGGGGASSNGTAATSGGSGGGAADNGGPYAAGAATQTSMGGAIGYGNAGGAGATAQSGAGGGGAGGAGQSGTGNYTPPVSDGGQGISSSISGTTKFYAGGGGGGGDSSERAGNGFHGGGRGTGTTTYYSYNVYTNEVNSTTLGSGTPNAIVNTGGGGGAGSYWAQYGGWSSGSGTGGSGIVIIRYGLNLPAATTTNATYTTTATQRIYTFTTSGTITLPNQGGPVNSVAPSISGTAAVGSVLTATTGTWSSPTSTPISYSYQWMRNDANISSETASTYTIPVISGNSTFKCVVTATDSDGNDYVITNGIYVAGGTNIDFLVVAGGGSGGNYTTTNGNGGGGGGGVLYATGFNLDNLTAYTITIGGGASAVPQGTSAAGNRGTNSSFLGTYIAQGGSGGASTSGANGTGGGSGGGGATNTSSNGTVYGGAQTQTSIGVATGYGNAGGSSSNSYTGGGGGGGAGGAGVQGTTSGGLGGNGGPGFITSITGTSQGFAGGGGGGGNSSERAGDGFHGGGRGHGTTTYYNYDTYVNEVNATTKGSGTPNAIANTGGGGGAGSVYMSGYTTPSWSTGSGTGGSGVVVIRHVATLPLATTTGSVTTSYGGGYVAYSFNSSGTISFSNPGGPTNTVAPVISGNLNAGRVLTVDSGTWTGTGTISYTYQWRRDGIPISGSTTTTYLTLASDIGKQISVVVSATDSSATVTNLSNIVTVTYIGYVDFIVVAGGGSGGNYTTTNGNGGGGGGGMLVANAAFFDLNSTINVTVGGGASAVPQGTNAAGNRGTNSSVGSVYIAQGGSGGASTGGANGTGGGSGGGGATNTSSNGTVYGGAASQPSITAANGNATGYGNAGGSSSNSYTGGGGGGGAGGAGVQGTTSGGLGGNGGQGRSSDISGVARFYAGGGGGGGNSSERAGDGFHGGGRGHGTTTYYNYDTYVNEVNATTLGSGTPNARPNTGGGGGAGSVYMNSYTTPQWTSGSGTGGSGVVIFRHASTIPRANTTGSVLITVAPGYTVYTFTGSGTISFTSFSASSLTNSVAPVVSGNLSAGRTLTTTTGTWSGTGAISYTYQWTRNQVNIGGATSNTYTTSSADIGSSISCVVAATDSTVTMYNSSNSVTITYTGYVDFIVVAGGGSGGSHTTTNGNGGGGGGGMLVANSVFFDTNSTINITVGAGGTAATGLGNSGSNSSLGTAYIAQGGGGGGTSNGSSGRTGGSGGGAAVYNQPSYYSLGAGAATQTSITALTGNATGYGFGGGSGVATWHGAGGGGAGGAGVNGSGSGGHGGQGRSSDISGTTRFYAGGGGGGGNSSERGGDGYHGGGRGYGTTTYYSYDSYPNEVNATTLGSGNLTGRANTGGGGGAGSYYGAYLGQPGTASSGAGGSGVVVIRHAIGIPQATTTGSVTLSIGGGKRIYTFTGSGTISFSSYEAVGPVNSVVPAITGTAVVGRTLTCSTGTWTGTGAISYSYQWMRNSVNIASATLSTYVPVLADAAQSISCMVTATDSTGSVPDMSNSVSIGYYGFVDFLLVAGGGAGGNHNSTNGNGGGGAGGMVVATQLAMDLNTPYVVVVGAGGAGIPATTASNGNKGSNSSFGPTFIAQGGGGGNSSGSGTGSANLSGGSGGGYAATGNSGGGYYGSSTQTTSFATPGGLGTIVGYGNNGGTSAPNWHGAGGGGAGGAGSSGSSSSPGGRGGPGRSSDISGTTRFYAGGGGGGGNSSERGGDGYHGGGRGHGETTYYGYSSYPNEVNATTLGSGNVNGVANTGGGGGAGSYWSVNVGVMSSGRGGSGTVIIRQLSSFTQASTTGDVAITTSGSYRIYTFTTSGTITLQDLGPTNSALPAITGSVNSGRVLTVSNGTWASPSSTTISYTYQWYRNYIAISGQTASTYTSVPTDADSLITAVVIATDSEGTVSRQSNAVTISYPGFVDFLIVAGGGAGGNHNSTNGNGGGGAGGVILANRMFLDLGVPLVVAVGGGGAGIPATIASNGSKGTNSQLGSLYIAQGGGGGNSSGSGTGSANLSGGSGGGYAATGNSGGGYYGSSTQTTTYAAPNGYGTIVGYGTNGGTSAPNWNGAGGGGAGGAGSSGSSSAPGGRGGPGISTDVSGTTKFYAGGGGGGGNSSERGGDGYHGGGRGHGETTYYGYSSYPNEVNSTTLGSGNVNGVVNTGGGGGAGSYWSVNVGVLSSGTGGSGIVIVRQLIAFPLAETSGTVAVTTTATHRIYTFTGSGTYTASNYGPINSVAPVITGTLRIGQVLTATLGTWSSAFTVTYAYQWYRNTSTVISGATSSTYTTVYADGDASISCTISATDEQGTRTKTSNSLFIAATGSTYVEYLLVGGGGGGGSNVGGGGGAGAVLAATAGASGSVAGQQSFTTVGTYTWVAPAGVTSVSVVCVGGGGGGGYQWSSGGGGGGGLGWKTSVAVTPGQSYTVVVGEGGTSQANAYNGGSEGGNSYFISLSTVAGYGGGRGGGGSSSASNGYGGGYTGDGGGRGGNGAYNGSWNYGGGGAGGYAGSGADSGSSSNGTAAPAGGGGGAGGWYSSTYGVPAGGGVGILGQGPSGGAVGNGYYGGLGGSGGAQGTGGEGSGQSGYRSINGGAFGGGGGGSGTSYGGGFGGRGAVRIIWGAGRTYPAGAGDAAPGPVAPPYLPKGRYTITVGAGGGGGAAGASTGPGGTGGNSSFLNVTATGGGGGGSGGSSATSGSSGGGGSSAYVTAGTGTSGQGNNGGTGVSNASGGGGGGFGAFGASSPGNGGTGIANAILETSYFWGGGGGGAGYTTIAGNGGAGGGGGGAPKVGGGGLGNTTALNAGADGGVGTLSAQTNQPGGAGGANTGSGGGGGSYLNTNNAGGNGGSGAVIIRHPDADEPPAVLAVNVDSGYPVVINGYRIYKWSTSGVFQTGAVGAPGYIVAPSVVVQSGSVTNGLPDAVLFCNLGTWVGVDVVYTYQWTSNGVNIAGATTDTLVTTLASGFKTFTCTVTATSPLDIAIAPASNSLFVLINGFISISTPNPIVPTQVISAQPSTTTTLAEAKFTTLAFSTPTSASETMPSAIVPTQAITVSGGTSTTLAEPKSVLLAFSTPTSASETMPTAIIPSQQIKTVLTYAKTDGVPIVTGNVVAATSMQTWYMG